ncbi:MAG: imelysin family protein [Ectothiorhodospiraceae bacterium]|jgi:putative iron-regulated protein|nr:imelysin family protein [Ectothiorhodospiraceae bacterium]
MQAGPTRLLTLSLAWLLSAGASAVHADAAERAVVTHYADMAAAMYEDSLNAAHKLKKAVDRLLASPSEATMKAARQTWIEARAPYQQTEVYRFGNAIVDDWEGKVNAWPLDEGLIDYVDPTYGTASDENPLYVANVIGHKTIKFGSDTIDVSNITKELLSERLHEIGGVEANVATGYHAIEFLLWGQDLNGTGPGAGNRPWTDYVQGKGCTNGNCDRRAQYLTVATDLLIDDLAWMAAQWKTGGEARRSLEQAEPNEALSAMLTGLGSLSYGELAGERMKLGLMLHDPEEEHDCFSDNTHNSHYYDVVGMRAVYLGAYTRVDGSRVEGPSLSSLVRTADASLDRQMRARLDATYAAMRKIKSRTATEAYDQMIGEGNAEGNATVQAAIDALTDQTRSIERVVAVLKLQPIEFEGSDSLDNPEAVFQ